MLDLISIGDATLDTFVKIHDATLMGTLEREASLLCFNYADKIPIVRLDQKVAGNAANVAIGGARLEMRAGLYSIVGDDDTGKKITRALKREHVSLKYLQVSKGHPSNYSVVLNFKGERTILVYHHPRHYVLPALEPTRWIYYTSVAPGFESLERHLLAHIRNTPATIKLGYNPGTHQLRKGLAKMKKVLRLTSVLYLNKEEAQGLVGNHEIPELMDILKSYGPEVVVITDGGKGSYAHNGKHSWYMPVFPATVVEKTGAGDSFAIAFIAALAHGEPVEVALCWGAANSASVIGKIGPQTGLLSLPEMKKALRRYTSIKPKSLKS